MARRRLESNGRRRAKAMDSAMAPRRQWTVQRQLKGKSRRDGNSMAMDDEEGCERDGNVGAAGGPTWHQNIKYSHKLNHYFTLMFFVGI
jgi:hypothetical protein